MMKFSVQDSPFDPELVRPAEEIRQMVRLQQHFQSIGQLTRQYGHHNLYSRDFTKGEATAVENATEGMTSPDNLALVNRVMAGGMEEQRHHLCQGHTMSRPPQHCSFLHHGNPYLRLGPFSLEVAATEPFIGVLRGVHTSRQVQEVRGGGRGG